MPTVEESKCYTNLFLLQQNIAVNKIDRESMMKQRLPATQGKAESDCIMVYAREVWVLLSHLTPPVTPPGQSQQNNWP